MQRSAFSLVVAGLVVCSSVACKRGSEANKAVPSASNQPPAPQASGLPVPPKVIEDAVNPRHEAAYSGPAGTVRGVVRIKGDPPPELPKVLAQIPEECAPAREVYGKLFREGPERTAADVLVAVTGYRGYVPEQRSIVEVQASGCAWSGRTFALTFGQRIDVVAKDRKAYVPDLMGAKMAAQIIALPGGGGSSLYPQAPGRFVLVDSLRIYSSAEVLVLKYATHAVTGLDGRYAIERIPAGRVRLSALLPAAGITVEKDIEIKPSAVLDVDLELPFDLAEFKEREAKAPEAALRALAGTAAATNSAVPAKSAAPQSSAPR